MSNSLTYNAITRLATVTGGVQNSDPKLTIYTVPTGKKAIPAFCVVRSATASLGGGTDFNFGTGVGADTHKEAVDLSGMTDATSYTRVDFTTAASPILNAADVFGVISETGATADAEATFDLYGYEYDA